MIQKYAIFILLATISLLVACERKPINEFPEEPFIEYQHMTHNEINALDSTANIALYFLFQDGDGDIGRDSEELVPAIFVKDSRDTSSNNFTYEYPFPYIPEAERPQGGLEGSVTLNFGREYFAPRDSLHIALRKDTLVYFIYIKDEAGNESNLIMSDTIYVSF